MAKSAAAANGGSGICCVVGSALPIIHMLRVYLGEWTSGLPAVLGGLFARLFLSRVYPIDARYATYKNPAKFRRGDESLIVPHLSVSVEPTEICLSEKTPAYIRAASRLMER